MSTPVRSAMSSEPSALDCPVCHEVFKQPKILPCGHGLCRPCLLSWGRAQDHAQCPLCRCTIVDPSCGKGFEEAVDVFPTDLVMEALVQGQQILSKKHICQFCVTHSATTLCLTCREFFCSTCAAGHKRQAMARDHKVEDLSRLTPQKLAASRPSFCLGHSGKSSEVYCSAHGVCICTLCATMDHRSCLGMKKLEDMVQDGCTTLREMASTLRKGESGLDEIISKLDQYFRDAMENLKVATDEAEAKFQQIESAIEAGRERLKKLQEEASSNMMESLKEVNTFLLRHKGKLTTHRNLVERACGLTTPDVVNGTIRSMRSRVDDLDCCDSLPESAKVVSKVMLVIDAKAVSHIEQEISELVKVKDIPLDVIGKVKLSEAGVAESGSSCLQPMLPSQPFGFHGNHGKHIVLSSDRLTAERTGGAGHAIVMSQDPMEASLLYEVRVDRTMGDWSYYNVWLGVVTQAPNAVTLPGWSVYLPSAVVVEPASVRVDGAWVKNTVGDPLRRVRAGGQVGLALDIARNLHLFINNQHVGMVASDLPHPAHFMVDVGHYWEKVTALPVRPIKTWTG